MSSGRTIVRFALQISPPSGSAFAQRILTNRSPEKDKPKASIKSDATPYLTPEGFSSMPPSSGASAASSTGGSQKHNLVYVEVPIPQCPQTEK